MRVARISVQPSFLLILYGLMIFLLQSYLSSDNYGIFAISNHISIHHIMRFIGNILWLVLGGFEAAIGYFSGSLALAITIVGIPVALQTFKLGLLCLWPFGARVESTDSPIGCIRIPLNILWMVFGGLWAWLMHILFGLLLAITIIGLPFAKQHFKMAGLVLAPFGKDVILKF